MQNDIGEVEKDTFDKVWKIVEEIGVEERHFNELQARYRNMASVWLLATFTAIGFVVTKTIRVGIPTELLVSGIAAAGCIGILLLLAIDIMVYHRLLEAFFTEGVKLERKFPWLPNFRKNILKIQNRKDVLFKVAVIYIAPIIMLIFISGGALSLSFCAEHRRLAIITAVLTIITGILVGVFICSKLDKHLSFVKSQLGLNVKPHQNLKNGGNTMNLPKIDEEVTTEQALELCRHYGFDYLVKRIESNPQNYKSWVFDGASMLPDEIVSKITGIPSLTEIALRHDLKYAYGEPDNDKEKLKADEEFEQELLADGGSKAVARMMFAIVHTFGCGPIETDFTWGFARK